ncbi:hypothetical protein DN53_02595 [Flagellimonas olearia]|uniref:Lanthionine synthetase C family protein n=2 Tax=Flagellimonas olearia TaxID=552546 RepID=A0A444VQZ0_9FLAO|nr:hypothetical protein DN53_02595 [Allomuricauda olearia]
MREIVLENKQGQMLKQELESKLLEIDRIVKQRSLDEGHIGLHTGLSGVSLFQFYLSKYRNTNDDSVIGVEILERIMEKINQGYEHPSFCNGISGAGWVLSHLEGNGFVDIDSDELLSGLDDFLHSAMIADMKAKNYDFLHGAIGHALYFVSRYKNTRSKRLKENYKEYLLEFIDLLKSNSEKEQDGLKWISVQQRDVVYNKYDLSLSHGIAGVIGILTKLHAHEDFRQITETLLRGAINYLMGHKKENRSFFLFPNLILQNGEESIPSRLGWCYGDLGIGMRLWFASKELNDKPLADEAISILKHCATRRTPDTTMVKDASLCHGSYGIALMFMRIHKETLDSDFEEAVEFWIQDGLNNAIHDDGYAGYKQWREKDSWTREISLLEGVTGIGLALIDYLAGFDTQWDECLMIS